MISAAMSSLSGFRSRESLHSSKGTLVSSPRSCLVFCGNWKLMLSKKYMNELHLP